MARLILKFPYLKPGGKKSPGGYLKYIATREGVEMAEDTSRHLPATAEQQKHIEKLLKQYRDCNDGHEYQDYLANPTRGNADAFISSILPVSTRCTTSCLPPACAGVSFSDSSGVTSTERMASSKCGAKSPG